MLANVMLNKFFTKPLSLTISGQEISFNTLAEFEFCLAGRTEVPARKMADLVELTSDDLKREAKSIKAVEKQFVEILSKSIENPASINSFLTNVDPHVFTHDHNWRDVMTALRSKGTEYNELRRVALVKYMQYLTSRQEIIKHTYSVKRLQRKTSDRGSETVMTAQANAEAANSSMRETVILDSSIVEAQPKKEERFSRLPKGEACVIDAATGSAIEFMLSKHPFKLKVDKTFVLIDDEGKTHELQEGKNILGRDVVCNVIVNSSYRDVSRLHLIIERLAGAQVRFTDLSSHGTFIESRLLTSNSEKAAG